MEKLSAAAVREVLNYNPDTGLFSWKNDHGYRGMWKAGTRAGYLTKQGYIKIRVEKKNYFAHRLAWLLTYDKWPDGLLDHIDRVKTNNRIANLREACPLRNSHNTILPNAKSTSGIRGVYFNKNLQKWQANISSNRKRMHLGLFKTKEEAQQAYLRAKMIYHPEYSGPTPTTEESHEVENYLSQEPQDVGGQAGRA